MLHLLHMLSAQCRSCRRTDPRVIAAPSLTVMTRKRPE
jgi:hypothetical protein